jgi:hypothetical protein
LGAGRCLTLVFCGPLAEHVALSPMCWSSSWSDRVRVAGPAFPRGAGRLGHQSQKRCMAATPSRAARVPVSPYCPRSSTYCQDVLPGSFPEVLVWLPEAWACSEMCSGAAPAGYPGVPSRRCECPVSGQSGPGIRSRTTPYRGRDRTSNLLHHLPSSNGHLPLTCKYKPKLQHQPAHL